MAEAAQVPIIILTGFLGSGKTTLLGRWLRSPALSGALVIVNELGEVGLDQDLLATSADDVPLLLDNGCACCAASADLAALLERLLADRRAGRGPRFNRLFLETTGIADPTPILEAVHGSATLASSFSVAGVVTTFDAGRGLEPLAGFPEARRQLEAASVVVLTKADLGGPVRIAELQGVMPDHAPHARVFVSANGDLPAQVVLDSLADVEPFRAVGDPSAASHADGVTTAFLPVPRPLPFPMLMGALNATMTGRRGTLLRLKGVVRFDGVAGLFAVQAVPGEGIMRTLVPERAGRAVRTGLTIISRGEPAALVAAEISRYLSPRPAGTVPTHAGAP